MGNYLLDLINQCYKYAMVFNKNVSEVLQLQQFQLFFCVSIYEGTKCTSVYAR